MRQITLLLVIFAFSSVSAAAQISEILKRMEQHQKALKSLQANMTTTRFSVQFGGTLTKESVVKFLPSAKNYVLKIDSTKPAPESFSIVGNQYLLYLPNLNMAYTGTITDSQINTFFLFSSLSKEKLKENYNVKYLGEEKVSGTIPAWHLELTPKTVQNFKTIELWIDVNGMLLQSKVFETGGDWTGILLGNLQKNIPFKGAEFKTDLPKQTKIVKNSFDNKP